ncbi:MAG: ATP-binding protein [Kiritimatiellae bacterium]|nr:ATP-binding protein [Kiritimatiellia bacterium]
MRANDITKVIDEQQKERQKYLGMPREALQGLESLEGFATIVTGVRRCGKSTLLNQWADKRDESIVSLHFDDLGLSSFETSDFHLLDDIIREKSASILILDEVQDIPEWERFVVGCLNMGRRVLVTGSNAKMLSREFGTKLTGRHINTKLYPFSYPEFLRFTNRQPSPGSLEEYLSVGGFPAYVKTRRRDVLTELFNDIIYRDIVVRYKLRDPLPVRSLAAFLIAHIGSKVSPSRLKGSIQVRSSGTILEYFSYLEETYLVRRLPRFAASQKAQMAFPKKVFACDTGLVTALAAVDDADRGHKLENLVYLKLLREDSPLYYYADDDNLTECDFIQEKRDGTISATQVTWTLTKENEEREFQGILHAMERFGLKESILVTHKQSDTVNLGGRRIRVIPAHLFLTDKR